MFLSLFAHLIILSPEFLFRTQIKNAPHKHPAGVHDYVQHANTHIHIGIPAHAGLTVWPSKNNIPSKQRRLVVGVHIFVR